MLIRWILYAIILLLALLGQLLDVGYLFHFIFYAVACFPLLGLAVSLPAMLGCRAVLAASERQGVRGDTVRWTLSLSNRFHLPVSRTTYRLRVSNRMTGEVHSGRSVLRDMVSEEDRVWTLETDHCGAVECRADRLWVFDCLGLFALPVRAPAGSVLLIGPIPEHPGPIELPEGTGTAVPLPRGKSTFGETYELRPYREGDSLRMIHWKMTAKRDELVTREPPEDPRPLPVLTFDHFGPRSRMDRTLDRLAGLSAALLERERPHEVRWAHPATGAVRRQTVSCEREWMACLRAILFDPVPDQGRSVLDQPLAVDRDTAIHHIHVTGEEARREP